MGSKSTKFKFYYYGDYFEFLFEAAQPVGAVGRAALRAAFDEAISQVPADKFPKVGGFRVAFFPK